MRIVFVLLIICFNSIAYAQSSTPSCDNPRDAAASLLAWLQVDSWSPQKAAACLALSPEQQASGERLAIQLKQVLDARGLYVPVDELPTDPDYTDLFGEHRVVPLPSFPAVVLEKQGDQWLYSASTVAAIPGLYEATFSRAMLELQKRLPAFFFLRIFGLFLWQMLYFVLLVIAAVLVGQVSQFVLTRQVVRLAQRAKLNADLTLIRRIRMPLTWIATGLVFLWGIPDLQLGVRPSQVLRGIATAILSLAVVVMTSRLIDVVSDLFARRAASTESRLDDQVIPLITSAIKTALWALGVVFVLQNAGVEVTALLAGVSVGGVAVALAAQDTVGNLFGSLTIFTDRPFQIGDWVIVAGSIEGVVEEVGFRSTRIRTFSNSLVTVPNAKVANSQVDNMGQRRFRRLKMMLGVRYDTPRDTLQQYITAVRAFLASNDSIAKTTLEVHLNNFGPSSIEILIYCFFDVPDWSAELEEKARCLMEFMRLAEELGVAFAFPSTSVYVETMPAGPVPSGSIER